MVTLLEPQTAAVTAGNELVLDLRFSRDGGRATSAQVVATGLAGVEEYDVYFSIDNGDNWELYQDGGAPVVITATSVRILLPAGLMFGFLKDLTAGNSGLYAFGDWG